MREEINKYINKLDNVEIQLQNKCSEVILLTKQIQNLNKEHSEDMNRLNS